MRSVSLPPIHRQRAPHTAPQPTTKGVDKQVWLGRATIHAPRSGSLSGAPLCFFGAARALATTVLGGGVVCAHRLKIMTLLPPSMTCTCALSPSYLYSHVNSRPANFSSTSATPAGEASQKTERDRQS